MLISTRTIGVIIENLMNIFFVVPNFVEIDLSCKKGLRLYKFWIFIWFLRASPPILRQQSNISRFHRIGHFSKSANLSQTMFRRDAV